MNIQEKTYLFVPAIKEDIVRKAVKSDCDTVIIDLEDAVAVDEKDAARNNVRHIGKKYENEKKIIVRINGLSTSYWEKDVRTVLQSGAKGIMLPKAERKQDVQDLLAFIHTLHEPETLEIIPLIETAVGVMNAYEIASSDELVSRIAFGSVDYCLDVRAEQSEEGHELLYARSQLVIASRAARKETPIDSVYVDLKNEAGLKKEVRHSKQIGLKAKLLIHPKQIPPVSEILKPSAGEIEEAKYIIRIFESALKEGGASVTYQEKLVDYPVYKKALEVIRE